MKSYLGLVVFLSRFEDYLQLYQKLSHWNCLLDGLGVACLILKICTVILKLGGVQQLTLNPPHILMPQIFCLLERLLS